MKALITRKIGMTSAIADDGAVRAVTILAAEPNVITQLKDVERDGYKAVQLGFGSTKKLGKSQAGHYKSSQASPKLAREFRVNQLTEDLKVGAQLAADVFEVGDRVHATATSKGKGFAGTIKRHNFHRQRVSHGGKGNTRKPGSIGSMYPQHILKGKKMAGQLGHTQVTTRNLKIALVDPDNKYLAVTGAVPGPNRGIVLIKEAKS
ncbi:MAG: 50S ribosomal protein L3 [Candidatus Saccharimonadales bacterium]